MISVKHIYKSFGDKCVLSDFSAQFPTDSFTVLSGASGVGKTTLLRILCGLEKADGGEITGAPERCAVVFQEPRLFPHLSALDNVRLVGEGGEDILRALGLGDALHKRPAELSGGMAQRVAIARALAYGADFIILDEPFKGLDGKLKQSVMEYVKKSVKGGILVTHSPDEAEFFADNTVYM